MCDSCSFKSSNGDELSKHRKSHFCHICGMFLLNSSSMINHMFKVHNYTKIRRLASKKFSCKLCCNVYSSAGGLHNHHKNVHNPATYACQTCGQVFQQPRQLSVHMVRHQSKKISCVECSSKFYFVSDLNKHINHVHRKVKSYECPKCGKYFCQRSVLNHHISQHTEAPSAKNISIDSSRQKITISDSPFITFVLESPETSEQKATAICDYVEVTVQADQ